MHVRTLFGTRANTSAGAACDPVRSADKTSFTAARGGAARPSTANKTAFTSALTGPAGWHIALPGEAEDQV